MKRVHSLDPVFVDHRTLHDPTFSLQGFFLYWKNSVAKCDVQEVSRSTNILSKVHTFLINLWILLDQFRSCITHKYLRTILRKIKNWISSVLILVLFFHICSIQVSMFDVTCHVNSLIPIFVHWKVEIILNLT